MKKYVRAATTDILDEPYNIQLETVKDLDVRPRTLARLADSRYADIRRLVACKNATDIATLLKLAKDPEDAVRLEVANRRDIPEEVLEVLATDSLESVKGQLLMTQRLDDSILKLMRFDESAYIRRLVAQDAGPDLLKVLYKDDESDVRYEVADNPNASSDILHRLVADEDRFVRRAVARNANTLVDDLVTLASDSDYAVRKNVAGNTHTPIEILGQLCDDPISHVSETAENTRRRK